MNRRGFLQSAGTIFSGLVSFPSQGVSAQELVPPNWRIFELTMRVEVLRPSGATRIWVPEALITDTQFQKPSKNGFQCQGGIVKTFRSRTKALGIITAEFPAGAKPVLTVTSRAATRNWAVNLSAPDNRRKLGTAERNHFCGRPKCCQRTVS